MSYKYHLIFIILSQLFLLMNRVINVNGQFISGYRTGQATVLVGKKIYFIGGVNYNERADATSDFFYYDFGNGIENASFVEE